VREQFKVEFHPSGRGKAQCPPDPAYPDGIDVDLAGQHPGCKVEFPHPAPECGLYVAHCTACHRDFVVTTAGRPDDPKSLTVPCRWKVMQN
jgi:hypothetical protein